MKNSASPRELVYKTLFVHPEGMTSKQLARVVFRLRGRVPVEPAVLLLHKALESPA